MSSRLLSALALVSLVSAASEFNFGLPSVIPQLKACVTQPTFYSCENTTAVANTCCSPTPGGLVLQTQFWDTYTGLEKKGQLLPKDSWTIHGLWPDNCDGSFAQYCDLSRQYDPSPSPNTTTGTPSGTPVPPYKGPGVDTFIKSFGRFQLLDYMNKYWVSQGQPNADFWAHEFSKHATCTSTFDVACYGPSYKKHQDVVDFFDAVVRAFQQFPTFDMLAAAGIVPSNKTGYTLSDISNALAAQTGAKPFLGCGGPTRQILNEVWYMNHVLGTEQFGRFKTIDTVTKPTCNATAPIFYYERTRASEREVRV